LEVEFDIADFDTAVLGIMEDLVVQVGIVEERFRGNAADIKTSATEGATLFNTGYLQ
jgi:hypothetical protein